MTARKVRPEPPPAHPLRGTMGLVLRIVMADRQAMDLWGAALRPGGRDDSMRQQCLRYLRATEASLGALYLRMLVDDPNRERPAQLEVDVQMLLTRVRQGREALGDGVGSPEDSVRPA